MSRRRRDGSRLPRSRETGPGLAAVRIDRTVNGVQRELRTRRYSRKTERAYVGWVRRYIEFHDGRDPTELGAREINAFLSAIAVDAGVGAATQNQAASALLFLYRSVLGR